MKRRSKQRTIWREKQVIGRFGMTTDARYRFIIRTDRPQAIQDFLVKLRYIPAYRVFLAQKLIFKASDFADRQFSLVEGAQHHTTDFRAKLANDIKAAHIVDQMTAGVVPDIRHFDEIRLIPVARFTPMQAAGGLHRPASRRPGDSPPPVSVPKWNRR